jgi:hypothetical protein
MLDVRSLKRFRSAQYYSDPLRLYLVADAALASYPSSRIQMDHEAGGRIPDRRFRPCRESITIQTRQSTNLKATLASR